MNFSKEDIGAAIIGYSFIHQSIGERISQLQAMEEGERKSVDAPASKPRRLSAEGRERIAAAARKRWALHRKAKAA